MTQKKAKQEYYERLIERIDEAIENEYYFEAAWIAYSIIEDRLDSSLRNTGGIPIDKRKREIRGIETKLSHIEKRSKTVEALRRAYYGDVLTLVHIWTKDRNALMHKLAEEAKSQEELLDEVSLMAEQGREVAREVAAAGRRLKKNLKKIPIQ